MSYWKMEISSQKKEVEKKLAKLNETLELYLKAN